MQNYIGTVLRFDERSYKDSLSSYPPVLRAIDEAGAAYEALDTTFVFNQEVFKDMIVNKSANIHKRYEAIINTQIDSLNFTSKAVIDSMKAQIKIDVQDLENKIQKIFTANINMNSTGLFTIHFDISNISIVDGKATVADETKEKIKDKCEIKIRTEDQNTLYNLALQLQADYKSFRDFLKEKNPTVIQSPFPVTFFQRNGGRLYETEQGELAINPNTILFGI